CVLLRLMVPIFVAAWTLPAHGYTGAVSTGRGVNGAFPATKTDTRDRLLFSSQYKFHLQSQLLNAGSPAQIKGQAGRAITSVSMLTAECGLPRRVPLKCDFQGRKFRE